MIRLLPFQKEVSLPTVASLKSGDLAAVQAALNQGQDIHARLHDGSTMLHIATSAAQNEVVKLLLQSGADVNTPWTQARVTAIHLAAVYGQASLLELFKQYGADFWSLPQRVKRPCIWRQKSDIPLKR